MSGLVTTYLGCPKQPIARLRVAPKRLSWTGQSRAAFERQYLTESFYLYHSFSVIVAQPLSSTLVRQAKLGASCRVKDPVGQGLANHPY